MSTQRKCQKVSGQVVAGIDVGGKSKGYHAVAMHGHLIVQTIRCHDPHELVTWCLTHEVAVIGIDAPCGWSATGSSRLAERSLRVAGSRIPCFMTPTRQRASASRFFDWVFQGEALYAHLTRHYQIYDQSMETNDHSPRFSSKSQHKGLVFETFPYGIICSLAGGIVPARPKLASRLAALKTIGIDTSLLFDLDFIDAALCAVAACIVYDSLFDVSKCSLHPHLNPTTPAFHAFGQAGEGFILLPAARHA